MADTGKNAEFTWNSVIYDADDCVSGWQLNNSINEVVYTCNGLDKGAAGTRSATFRASLALSATDTTKHQALTVGTSAAFEAHPAGDTATYIEITSTDALLVTADLSAPTNGIITADLVFRLNDITFSTAT